MRIEAEKKDDTSRWKKEIGCIGKRKASSVLAGGRSKKKSIAKLHQDDETED